jgi:hypothetical protein
MNKKSCIYKSDSNNNMRFVCMGDTKEKAEAKLFVLLGEKVDINWSSIDRIDPQAGDGMWYGVVVERSRHN